MLTARRSPWIAAVVVLLLGWGLAQATSLQSLKVKRATLASAASAHVAGPAHIVVLLLENKEYGAVVGSRQAPFFNSLARHNVLLTNSFAVSHPSEPNYLALTAGTTFGVHNDCGQCVYRGLNIADQIARHHMTWKAYMQAMPSPCFKGSEAGPFPHQYAAKHDPFIHFADIRNRPARCRHIVGLRQLPRDLGRGRLPRYSFISPDLCFDMHSCSVQTGDNWLRSWVPKIIPKLGPHGVLIVLFDEGSTSRGCCSTGISGGHVAVVIAGPGARHGVRIRRPVDHYSILRLIEDAWGFPRLAHAADATTHSILGWRR